MSLEFCLFFVAFLILFVIGIRSGMRTVKLEEEINKGLAQLEKDIDSLNRALKKYLEEEE